MGPLSIWVDFALDMLEVAALCGIIWQLSRLRRDMASLLRVIRRMDRKMGVEVVTSGERGSGMETFGLNPPLEP